MPEPAQAALPRPDRRPGFWLLAGGVVLVHLLLGNRLAQDRAGWGAGDAPPPRIEVAFVRALAPAAPPAAAPQPVTQRRRLPAVAAAVPQPAASAPAAAASAAAQALAATAQPALPPALADDAAADRTPPATAAPDPAPAAQAAADPAPRSAAASAELPAALRPVPEPAPELPAPATADAAPGAVTAAAGASAPVQAFPWPPSTQLRYRLHGHYRGPVDGSARVEWLREGQRYQVHLSTVIGPALSRRIRSEGELTPQGLAPQRFDGEQKVIFRDARRWQLRFGPDEVLLSDGKRVPTLPGAQDEASQFVQLTWLFTTRPERLRVGSAVEMPLAISRRLERWTYDVVGEETLHFPFGAVPAFHLKPRRAAGGGDLSAEIWIAPTLQYLPVRILIRDARDSWIDLTLEAPPLQAAPGR